MARRVKIYKRYERFWHWAQVLIVFVLIITGLEIHGSFTLFGFDSAVDIHIGFAYALIILVLFTIFWQFTTGEWRQYVPTTVHFKEMMHYYVIGIFKNEPHPHRKNELSKTNPIQRLTYFLLKILVFPMQILSGFLYYGYNRLQEKGTQLDLEAIAYVHTFSTFLLIAFIVVHVYMTTTGTTATSNIKAMLTGWEDLPDEGES